MLTIGAGHVAASLPFERLVPALRAAFSSGAEAPPRHHHAVKRPGEPTATLLLMPAWRRDGYLGVKVVSVFPGNAARGAPALSSSYLLCDGETGRHLALIDGDEITGRRTAAVSALAASYLARPDASSLLVVGAGRVAGLIAGAMRAVRPIRRVQVWNRDPQRADALADRLRGDGFEASTATDLREAVTAADVVSCATLATAPLIAGAWLRPGVHLDLIGSFTPTMREADDEAVRRAAVFVDTSAALDESGDLLGPIAAGMLAPGGAVTELAGLCRGEHAGRSDAGQITLFKSVGTALADLAAATLAYDAWKAGRLTPPCG